MGKLFVFANLILNTGAVFTPSCPDPADAFLNSISQNSKKTDDCTDWANQKYDIEPSPFAIIMAIFCQFFCFNL